MSMTQPVLIQTPDQLRQLLEGHVPTACHCALRRCGPAWDSVSDTDWPKDQLRCIASLRPPGEDEPTFEEYHPSGTRYDSAHAPVALGFFPYNRCEVWQCERCDRHWLRYTEFGGYYVDPRARPLKADLIVDTPQV
jgi:hypothetical protein